jgi:hypothetical protein
VNLIGKVICAILLGLCGLSYSAHIMLQAHRGDHHIQGHFYAHGIADTKDQAYCYTPYDIQGKNNAYPILPQNVYTFDMPDATTKFWRVNFTKTDLAQSTEISTIYHHYHTYLMNLKKQHNNIALLNFGLSRGGSGQICFAGLFNIPHTKIMIIESAFDTMEHVAVHMLKKVGLENNKWAIKCAESLISKVFMKYKSDGIKPIDMVKTIRSDMAILFVCVKNDALVPYESTIALYKAAIATNHPHAYILILDQGEHAKILSGPEGYIYQQVAHAFMKKYGFDHDPSLAEQGAARFALCQPDPVTLPSIPPKK